MSENVQSMPVVRAVSCSGASDAGENFMAFTKTFGGVCSKYL